MRSILGRYADERELRVGEFFSGLTEHSPRPSMRARLGELLQQNIAVINLWTEYRYKGYNYLRKRERRKLYANLDIITGDFEQFRTQHVLSSESLLARIRTIVPGAQVPSEQAQVLQAIMDYLSPERGVYEYRESSSFGRLLQDPTREILVGDCNQIVTLYVYLFSRYFPVNELRIQLLPGHVALHYSGVDIEATSGEWANYVERQDAVLMPIEEIVSVNLLDTTDSYLKTHEVSAEDFLQAARFAFILSHDRDIVTKNLDAAYGSLINSLMQQHNYPRALQFAKQGRAMELLAVVGNNGALYYMSRHQFKKARKYAEYSPKRVELIRDSYRNEGAYQYEALHYYDAAKAFEKYGDQKLVQECYAALYFAEQSKLPDNLTTETIGKHAATIKRMLAHAKKSGNRDLIEHATMLTKHL